MFWLIFAFLTGFAVLSVLWPLIRTPRGLSHGATAIALYKAQIAEIDRDAAQGLVAPEDAQSARTEAARRLIVAEAQAKQPQVEQGGAVRLAALTAAVIFVPALAFGLYRLIGNPDLADLPLSARLDDQPARQELMDAVAKIEALLTQHPDDGRGHEVLAPVYLRLGRANDAVQAMNAALRLLGETPERLAGYGEALVYAANGVVTGEARRAFEKASANDPSLVKPRFFLGLVAEQDGDISRTKAIWSALVADAPEAAPWKQGLRARIAALPGGSTPPQGDSPEARPNLAAKIQAMPEAEQASAIRGMVDRLASRLAQNGQDLEGWLRLARAYAVLNESDKARTALNDAKRNLAGDATALARIDALARELGLEG